MPEQFPDIRLLIDRGNLNSYLNYPYYKKGPQEVAVLYTGTYDTMLKLGYILKDPSPITMSENFRLAVQYYVAQQLALKYIQQRSVQQSFELKYREHIAKAQRFALENKNSYSYFQPSFAESPKTTLPDGTSASLKASVYKTIARG